MAEREPSFSGGGGGSFMAMDTSAGYADPNRRTQSMANMNGGEDPVFVAQSGKSMLTMDDVGRLQTSFTAMNDSIRMAHEKLVSTQYESKEVQQIVRQELMAMLDTLKEQERAAATMMREKGLHPPASVQLASAPDGAADTVKNLYLERSLAKLEQQIARMQEMMYTAMGAEVPDALSEFDPPDISSIETFDGTVDEEADPVGEYVRRCKGLTPDEEAAELDEAVQFERRSRLNPWGGFILFVWCLCCIFYAYTRIWHSLGPLNQYMAYGIIVFIFEMLGALSIFLYGLTILKTPVIEDFTEWQPRRKYHIRTLIPSYKESLAIIKKTIMACKQADLPPGTVQTIYLCDDGKDKKKRDWMLSFNDPDMVYITGRKRAKDEINGKSNNLNNCLKLIYPKGTIIPLGELMCLFDADQVCSKSFFTKTIPFFDSGDNVALVVSPQCVYNVHPGQDLFNHSNIHFWEYMQPGYDAIGFISCTGTNMLIRNKALQEANWFPTHTVTEDWDLGMTLKKNGWEGRYVQEYLAIGEAPEEVRNAYQQRSRWCKGHFQTFFSDNCPLTDTRLSVLFRLLYSGSCMSYISAATTVPLFSLVPIISLLFGIFPIAINFWTVLGITLYCVSTAMVVFYCRTRRHLMAMWFAQTCNSVLWFTFFKGATMTPINQFMGKKLTFKTTLKGAARLANTPVRDLMMPTILLLFSLLAFILGCISLKPDVNAPLAISLCWALWNVIPFFLLLVYAFMGQGTVFRMTCMLGFGLNFMLPVLALVLLWLLYPHEYDWYELTETSLHFWDAQWAGKLEYSKPIKVGFRQDAALRDSVANVTINNIIYKDWDLVGGYFNGGAGGNVKLTANIAYTTAMLSWAYLMFSEAFAKAGLNEKLVGQIAHGAEYLMKAHQFNKDEPQFSPIVAQVGSLSDEIKAFRRAEDVDSVGNRPVYIVWPAQGASDLTAQISAGLAAASIAVRDNPKNRAFADEMIDRAGLMFNLTIVEKQGKYTDIKNPDGTYAFQDALDNGFGSSSYYDDQLWASAWLYTATKNGDRNSKEVASMFLKKAKELFSFAQSDGGESPAVTPDWIFYPAAVLLATQSQDSSFDDAVFNWFKAWLCAQGDIKFSKMGRAWHPESPTLGDSALLAFLAGIYSEMAPNAAQKYRRAYKCLAMNQGRYLIGDKGPGFVIGFGPHPPKKPQHAGSACPQAPAQCSKDVYLFNTANNPYTLYGALLEGPSKPIDVLKDKRSDDANRVYLDNNVGLTGLAGFLAHSELAWMSCLLGNGYFSKNPVC